MKNNSVVGAFVAIGGGVGAAMFAATGQPAMIAVGAGLGVAFGMYLDWKKKKD